MCPHCLRKKPADVESLLITDVDVAGMLGISRAHLHTLRAGAKFGPAPIRLGQAAAVGPAFSSIWMPPSAHSVLAAHNLQALSLTLMSLAWSTLG
jgi:hypothetical protein